MIKAAVLAALLWVVILIVGSRFERQECCDVSTG